MTFHGAPVYLTIELPHEAYMMLREHAGVMGTETSKLIGELAAVKAQQLARRRVEDIGTLVRKGRADWQVAAALDLTNAQVATERRKLALPANYVPRPNPTQPRRKQ